ncbi:hypothetical protein [uncultured Porphyromonas sp.]|uniref:type IX secretion system anionic LPS delivery protein PorZ n=1 Tax=uncultured Porphyromonas sp. TaxID=159274 RepID=UPI00280504D8|nr:hypothetical protein [uncultured Porphyromonas sp.]
MKASIHLLLLPLLLCTLPLTAQEPLWQWHLAVGDVELVADLPEQVLFTTEGVIGTVSPEHPNEIHLLDGLTPISDLDARMIRYSPSHKVTTVYYASGRIDLIYSDHIYNLVGISDNSNLNDKTATRIFYYKEYAFIAGHFGLMQIDLNNHQIVATAFLGKEVLDAFALDEKLYALTKEGLRSSTLSQNLQDPASWSLISGLPAKEMTSITALPDGSLWYIDSLKNLYRTTLTQASATPQMMAQSGWAQRLFPLADGVAVAGADSLLVWRSGGERIRIDLPARLQSLSGDSSADRLWFTAGGSLYKADLASASEGKVSLDKLSLEANAPNVNKHFYITFQHGRLYSVSGGRNYNAFWIPGHIQIYTPPRWDNWTYWQIVEQTNYIPVYDLVSIAVDPHDANHYFVGSWGEGLYEIQGRLILNRYTPDNAPFVRAWDNDSPTAHNVRVGSLCYDPRGNLWMSQGQGLVANPLVVRTPDGTMKAISYPDIELVNAFGPMLALPNGVKWLLIYHRSADGNNGVFIFDDKGTPLDQSDDEYRLVSKFVDRTGKEIAAKHYYDLALDPSGSLWIATDKGPICVANPSSFISQSTPLASRPVGGQEPNLYYVLDNMPITAIAIDALGNKWCGTGSDGLYLLSSDGTQLLAHYTKDNSPLLTNDVLSLAIDKERGVLYIATSAGLVSLYIGQTSDWSAQSKEVYIYPNPLRPEDPDLVTLTQLPAGTTVRILDGAGNLIYQEVAQTGELTITTRLPSGERYPSGIYHALLSDSEGKHSYSIPFAVI